jgi:hypothetical protein
MDTDEEGNARFAASRLRDSKADSQRSSPRADFGRVDKLISDRTYAIVSRT